MDNENHYIDIQQRIADFGSALNDFKDIKIWKDLLKMWRNLKSIEEEISKELVECRRLKRPTAKFTTLVQKLEQQLEESEQNLTLAKLLDTYQ